MNLFETKLRGFHARTIENIMARSTGFYKPSPPIKHPKTKAENLTTYLRKFQIDRENLNLAKRILLCESEHDHKYYKRQWRKTKNILRVRSNFKPTLSNEQPRIFKFQPILGKGNCLVTIKFTRFESNSLYFREQSVYALQVLVKSSTVSPTGSIFPLQNLGSIPMSFYVPFGMRNKKIGCKILQVKENHNYEKGKFQIDLADEDQQVIEVYNGQGKVISVLGLKCVKQYQANKRQRKEDMSFQKQNKGNKSYLPEI